MAFSAADEEERVRVSYEWARTSGMNGRMGLDEPSLVMNWMNSTTHRPMSPFAVSEIRASGGTAFFMILMTGFD